VNDRDEDPLAKQAFLLAEAIEVNEQRLGSGGLAAPRYMEYLTRPFSEHPPADWHDIMEKAIRIA
jgi:hypothetical protein